MIIDRGFFGFARTGTISDFKYPLILDSSREEMLSMNEGINKNDLALRSLYKELGCLPVK